VTKVTDRWHSPHLDRTVNLARWGDYGRPVLVFPTAGGDAEEIERFHVVDACAELISDGRAKIFSCDSLNGRAMLANEGDSLHLSWILRRFVEFVGHELVPAIRADCQTDDIEIIVAGSSIGAYNALAALCRYPDVFTNAICMSGTYDITKWLDNQVPREHYFASPLHFLPGLGEGEQLDKLRQRFVLFTHGTGRWEEPEQSWRAADVLGKKGIPNRVDAWEDWDHDWPTWRKMAPRYLAEIVP